MNKSNDEIKNTATKTLLLYHHPYSYYSQKVLMALYEKQLPFEQYVINLVKNEQYEQWFLDLNPRGEFPVLQDSAKIIPSSNNIIDYLEDKFQTDDSIIQLISTNKEYKIRQKVTYFRYQLEQIQSGIITLGSFYHEEFVGRPKLPFIGPVRTAMKNAEENRIAFLHVQMECNPRYRHVFQQKINNSKRRHEIITSYTEFLQQLDLIENVLDKVEDELASHSDSALWLCCDTFTIADINLSVLLERLNVLGLEKRFWGNGKRPYVEFFYQRVRSRESFKKTMPNIKTHLQIISQGNKTYVTLGKIVTSVLVVFGSWIFIRKINQ